MAPSNGVRLLHCLVRQSRFSRFLHDSSPIALYESFFKGASRNFGTAIGGQSRVLTNSYPNNVNQRNWSRLGLVKANLGGLRSIHGTTFVQKKPSKCSIVQSRKFCSSSFDERAMEEEAERKIGWFLKLLFAGTATIVGYQFLPYLGDNIMQQSVSLLHVKDPLFKRMGASRLARFATDDKRRMKIVEIGGAKQLVNMLGVAKDDRTRKEALKALVALAHSDEAVAALHNAGAISVIKSTPDSVEDSEVEKHKFDLLKRFQDLRYDNSS